MGRSYGRAPPRALARPAVGRAARALVIPMPRRPFGRPRRSAFVGLAAAVLLAAPPGALAQPGAAAAPRAVALASTAVVVTALAAAAALLSR